MIEVNKSMLARRIGKSNAIVTRLKNDGVLNGCFLENGKIDLYKALKNIECYKGYDYIHYRKMAITPDVSRIDSRLYLSEEELNLFYVNFQANMFVTEDMNDEELEKFKVILADTNSTNRVLAEFCTNYGKALLPYALDFQLDIEDVSEFYEVEYIEDSYFHKKEFFANE